MKLFFRCILSKHKFSFVLSTYTFSIASESRYTTSDFTCAQFVTDNRTSHNVCLQYHLGRKTLTYNLIFLFHDVISKCIHLILKCVFDTFTNVMVETLIYRLNKMKTFVHPKLAVKDASKATQYIKYALQ